MDFFKVRTLTVIQKEWYTIEQCLANPDTLYVFGDNYQRQGKGGQARIRDCHNAYGVATKWTPSMDYNAFFRDNNVNAYSVILSDLKELLDISVKKKYSKIVFPLDGLGTGLSKLPENAPTIFERFLVDLYEMFGLVSDRNGKFLGFRDPTLWGYEC